MGYVIWDFECFWPSTILHRDLFTRFGDFNEDFHYCMDTGIGGVLLLPV